MFIAGSTLVQQNESFVGAQGWNPCLRAKPPKPHIAKFSVCNTRSDRPRPMVALVNKTRKRKGADAYQVLLQPVLPTSARAIHSRG
jgi:hypothetical protein